MRALVLVALALAGCASFQASVVAPPVTAEDLAQARTQPAGPRRQIEINQSFDQLRRQDQRLADIAFRLAAANADLCPDRRPLIGVTLHTLSQYSQRLAAELEDRFPTPRPGLLAVAAGSPAALAGLQPDDVLLTIGGAPFAASPAGDQPSARDTQAANMLLTQALSVGQASRLRIDRAGQEMELSVTPVPGCAYQAELAPASNLGPLAGLLLVPPGSSAGRGAVLISERMAAYARDDDELAIVVGHEYAHNLLHHPASVGPAGEAEADYVGLYLTARAGYDIGKAAAFWTQMTRDYPSEPFSHSGPQARIAAIIAAGHEIEAKRAAGRDLLPNFRAPQPQ
ncbi:MAG: hypothetical protein JWM33_3805 [Caulobacteraceae bacterium]|nr:hypothetical protein [Caulobacteraceae bacterium]